MSSSTSSSDSRPERRTKSEWLVVIAVLAGLLTAEILLRTYQDSLSGDVAHMNAADSIVTALDESPGLRILMAGNSLLYRGVDPVQLDSTLEAQLGREVSVGMLYPDGTGTVVWSYLFRRVIFNPGRTPDVMVLAFGPGHLRDYPPSRELLRLAAHHVDTREIGRLFAQDLPRFEDRSEFLLARASKAFAFRDRISPRVFDAMIPNYRELAPMLLQISSAEALAAEAPTGPTFAYLGALLDDAAQNGVPVIALPMPAPALYELEADAAAAFTGRGDPILPTLVDIGLEPERFYDGQHLDPEGRTRFTEFVAPLLAEALARVRP